MRETGTVVEATDTTATVELQPPESCDACGCKAKCAGTQGKAFVVQADNLCGAKPGDCVEVEMTPVSTWLSMLFIFVVPLLLMLLGLGLARGATGQDWAGALGAVVGLALGFGVLWIANRTLMANAEYRPTVVRVMPS